MSVTIKVSGHPRPQPRPRVIRGRAISTADPLARAWIAAVERECQGIETVKDTWLKVELAFRFPTEDNGRLYLPHTFVPDVDNLAKLVLDALQRSKVIKNDSSVSNLVVRKTWDLPAKSGVTITVCEDKYRNPIPDYPDWLTP